MEGAFVDRPQSASINGLPIQAPRARCLTRYAKDNIVGESVKPLQQPAVQAGDVVDEKPSNLWKAAGELGRLYGVRKSQIWRNAWWRSLCQNASNLELKTLRLSL